MKTDTHSASVALSKDIISDDDIADYLNAINSTYTSLININTYNTHEETNRDIEMIQSIQKSNDTIREKLRNKTTLSQDEIKFLKQTLNSILHMARFNPPYLPNQKGVTAYIAGLDTMGKDRK